ncbi:MAG: GNAT family N-acetyltransferase [Alphaproteobacteria bacterium]|nr:GNAT family N-acetyltransferase [Alphaproteobacteria bacterium]
MLKMPEKIMSERIVLERPIQPTFKLAEEIFEKVDLSRKTLREWLSWVDGTKRPEDRYSWLVNGAQKNWETGEGYAYLIRDKKTHALLGVIDLVDCSEKHKSAEIGYWLSDDAVGHGYMTEAVTILEMTAFKKGLNRIVIRTDTKNVRSDNVPKRCVYNLEGTLHSCKWDAVHKRFADIHVWAKLKSEWDAEQKKD